MGGQSFIPAMCVSCGGTLGRISHTNPDVQCVNNDCQKTFELREKL